MVIADVLSEDAAGAEIGEAANVETLLRLMRRRSRPVLRALPPEKLPLFSAAWQGLVSPGRDVRGVQEALDRLMGLPAPAGAWEADILPARVMPYLTPLIDQVFRDSDLLWFGAGRERVAFAFPEDLELFLPATPEAGGLQGRPAQARLTGEGGAAGLQAGPEGTGEAEGLGEGAPGRGGAATGAAARRALEARGQILDLLARAAPARLDFQALAARIPATSDALSAALWDLAWEGRITNDTFAALRRGIETGFRSEVSPASAGREASTGRPSRRAAFQRWKATRPLAGSWLALEPASDADPLEREELAKERVRQVLRRHGVVFREMLAHELPPLQWPRLFRALRLMELSGEVLSGRFFDGVPGLQFLAPSALPLIEDGLPEDALYWMSAQDPASPCGLGLSGLPYALPPRASGIHLVFRGSEPMVVSRRMGRDLLVRVPPRHPYLAGCLGALRHLVERAFQPARVLEVETVNGVGVLGSPYAADLLDAGFERGLKSLSLRKGYLGLPEKP
jgi:ATP-dependent Lhr-like helicase